MTTRTRKSNIEILIEQFIEQRDAAEAEITRLRTEQEIKTYLTDAIRQSTSASRLERFEAYRATLNDDERADLDLMIEAICARVRKKRGQHFGPMQAKELLMALLEHLQKNQVR